MAVWVLFSLFVVCLCQRISHKLLIGTSFGQIYKYKCSSEKLRTLRFSLHEMTKVYPKTLAPLPSSSSYLSSKQETFTIWMKSLVLSGKGCTVFDSTGKIVYRVDNYNYNHRNKVHLMDFRGKVLFTILRKNFMLLGPWKGYRSTDTDMNPKKPGFQVRKTLWVRKSDSLVSEVTEGLDKNQSNHYKMERWNTSKSTCKIVNQFGVVVAEVKRKQSTCGVMLGEDVLSMVVEPSIDTSLIMGLVVTYSLINSKM